MGQAAAADTGAGALTVAGGVPDGSGGADGAASEWSIEVAEGLNKGAIVPLGHGTFRIGSGLGNDIVLADGAIADEQVVLNLGDDGAELEPLAAGVAVGGKPLRAGGSIPVRDGTQFTVGETVVRLHGPKPPKRRAAWLLLGVPVALFGLFAGALIWAGPHGNEVVPPGPPVPLLVLPPSDVAARALQDRLRELGLDGQVRITNSPGTVMAEGSLAKPDLARWNELQRWFDERYKNALTLVTRLREAPPDDKPNVQIRAVSVSPVPYMILADGDKYVEGGVVDGGWTIEKIMLEKVVFSRNGRRAEVLL